MLSTLRDWLKEDFSWEEKGELVELLVAGIVVDTVGEGSDKRSEIQGTYTFNGSETLTARTSLRSPLVLTHTSVGSPPVVVGRCVMGRACLTTEATDMWCPGAGQQSVWALDPAVAASGAWKN